MASRNDQVPAAVGMSRMDSTMGGTKTTQTPLTTSTQFPSTSTKFVGSPDSPNSSVSAGEASNTSETKTYGGVALGLGLIGVEYTESNISDLNAGSTPDIVPQHPDAGSNTQPIGTGSYSSRQTGFDNMHKGPAFTTDGGDIEITGGRYVEYANLPFHWVESGHAATAMNDVGLSRQMRSCTHKVYFKDDEPVTASVFAAFDDLHAAQLSEAVYRTLWEDSTFKYVSQHEYFAADTGNTVARRCSAYEGQVELRVGVGGNVRLQDICQKVYAFACVYGDVRSMELLGHSSHDMVFFRLEYFALSGAQSLTHEDDVTDTFVLGDKVTLEAREYLPEGYQPYRHPAFTPGLRTHITGMTPLRVLTPPAPWPTVMQPRPTLQAGFLGLSSQRLRDLQLDNQSTESLSHHLRGTSNTSQTAVVNQPIMHSHPLSFSHSGMAVQPSPFGNFSMTTQPSRFGKPSMPTNQSDLDNSNLPTSQSYLDDCNLPSNQSYLDNPNLSMVSYPQCFDNSSKSVHSSHPVQSSMAPYSAGPAAVGQSSMPSHYAKPAAFGQPSMVPEPTMFPMPSSVEESSTRRTAWNGNNPVHPRALKNAVSDREAAERCASDYDQSFEPSRARQTATSARPRLPAFNDRRQNDMSNQPQAVVLSRIEMGQDVRTTVMLRNLPDMVDTAALKAMLDQTSRGHYDFTYLRVDFSNNCNVGYAFINFVRPEFIANFSHHRVGRPWSIFRSKKIAEISYATIQGQDCLIAKFRNSSVMQEFHGFRPKVFYNVDSMDIPSDKQPGDEAPFPAPDNQSKLQRSLDNAQTAGLYPPRAGQQAREERRYRSQFDRGNPRAVAEEAEYAQFQATPQMVPVTIWVDPRHQNVVARGGPLGNYSDGQTSHHHGDNRGSFRGQQRGEDFVSRREYFSNGREYAPRGGSRRLRGGRAHNGDSYDSTSRPGPTHPYYEDEY